MLKYSGEKEWKVCPVCHRDAQQKVCWYDDDPALDLLHECEYCHEITHYWEEAEESEDW